MFVTIIKMVGKKDQSDGAKGSSNSNRKFRRRRQPERSASSFKRTNPLWTINASPAMLALKSKPITNVSTNLHHY